jgi:hypothetical protein
VVTKPSPEEQISAAAHDAMDSGMWKFKGIFHSDLQAHL